MPDYIPYTTDEMQPEAPATSLHFARWFQNWEAGFGGANGAPRLHYNALGAIEIGSEIKVRLDAEQSYSAGGAAHMVALKFVFAQAGSVRVSYDGYGNYQTYCRTYVVRVRGGADTVLATFSEGATWTSHTVDVPVAIGDAVEVRLLASSVSNPISNTRCRYLRLKTSGQALWPCSQFMQPYTLEG